MPTIIPGLEEWVKKLRLGVSPANEEAEAEIQNPLHPMLRDRLTRFAPAPQPLPKVPYDPSIEHRMSMESQLANPKSDAVDVSGSMPLAYNQFLSKPVETWFAGDALRGLGNPYDLMKIVKEHMDPAMVGKVPGIGLGQAAGPFAKPGGLDKLIGRVDGLEAGSKRALLADAPTGPYSRIRKIQTVPDQPTPIEHTVEVHEPPVQPTPPSKLSLSDLKPEQIAPLWADGGDTYMKLQDGLKKWTRAHIPGLDADMSDIIAEPGIAKGLMSYDPTKGSLGQHLFTAAKRHIYDYLRTPEGRDATRDMSSEAQAEAESRLVGDAGEGFQATSGIRHATQASESSGQTTQSVMPVGTVQQNAQDLAAKHETEMAGMGNEVRQVLKKTIGLDGLHALWLSKAKGQSISKVADLLNMTPQAAEKLVHKETNDLRTALTEDRTPSIERKQLIDSLNTGYPVPFKYNQAEGMKRALWLMFNNQQSLQTTAKKLGVAESTVALWQKTALDKLKELHGAEKVDELFQKVPLPKLREGK